MNRHIGHLVEAYVSGQLKPRQARRLLNHVRTCDYCMTLLAEEEHMSFEVEHLFQVKLSLSRQAQERLWSNIVTDLQRPSKRHFSSRVLGPVLLCAALLISPFILLTGQKAIASDAGPAGTLPASESNAPALAPTGTLVSFEEVDLTAAPLTDNDRHLPVATMPAPESTPRKK